MKIIRILEFHIKSRNHENLNIPCENHENQTKKLWIPYDNYENHENHWIHFENYENHGNQIIPHGNFENHENLKII